MMIVSKTLVMNLAIWNGLLHHLTRSCIPSVPVAWGRKGPSSTDAQERRAGTWGRAVKDKLGEARSLLDRLKEYEEACSNAREADTSIRQPGSIRGGVRQGLEGIR